MGKYGNTNMLYSEWSTVNLVPETSQNDQCVSPSSKYDPQYAESENKTISTRKFVFEPSPVLKKRDHTYKRSTGLTVKFKNATEYKYISDDFTTTTAVTRSMFEGSPKMYRRFGDLERYAT